MKKGYSSKYYMTGNKFTINSEHYCLPNYYGYLQYYYKNTMEVLQPSMGLQTCSTYTTLHDTTVTTVTTGFMGKSQSLLM